MSALPAAIQAGAKQGGVVEGLLKVIESGLRGRGHGAVFVRGGADRRLGQIGIEGFEDGVGDDLSRLRDVGIVSQHDDP